ncbi:MAG: flagellar basal body-associated FliL family protein [Proteobacteria bacterium]|jgi:flagellar FliL protein|nr:flagellar basal body-associated FliL family protein [Pseudomonadota bacterium]
MADDNEDEKKSGGLKSLLKKIGIFGGLISIGMVVGYFFFAPAGDVIEKEELEEMIERSMEERDAAKTAEEEANADPEKVSKDTPEEETFETIYYEFAGTFTTNLDNSRKMLQLGLAVSTQYDDTVMQNVEAHELGLRSIILQRIGNYTEEDIKGEAGRKMLSEAIKEALNTELEALEGFGGIEKVHFTSFVLQ